MILKYVGSAVALIAMALISACGKQISEPIKIGINPWPGYEYLYLAQEKGFYEEVGVPVKIIEYGSLSEVRRGYERGKLDAMASTLIEVLQVKNYSSRDPQIFLIADFSNGGDVIVARNPITSLSGLKGKKIGADTTSLPIFMLTRALEMNGLSLSDVEVVALEQSDMEAAYVNGDIDVAVTYPPVSVRLLNRNDSQVIFSSKSIPGEVVDVVSVEKSVWDNRPQDIEKILSAWEMALNYAKNNREEANSIMAKREGISVTEFEKALAEITIVSVSDQHRYFESLERTLKKVREVLLGTGILSTAVPVDCCIRK